MDLKFYLNKIIKIDNIEHYTLDTLKTLTKVYDKFLEKTEGTDPDYPLIKMGDKKGKTISVGKNVYSLFDNEEDIPEDFEGIKTVINNKM